MRTTVNIDRHLLGEVKQIAARGNRTIGSVLEDAVRRLIAEDTDVRPAPEFALPSHGAGGLRSGVDLGDRDGIAELLQDNTGA